MNKIKELRLLNKIKQSDLAKLCNTSQANVSAWELDKWQPSQEDLSKIADYFNVSVDYLLGRSSDPSDYADQGVTNLTEDEAHLLDLYRSMNEKNKNIYIGLGETLTEK